MSRTIITLKFKMCLFSDKASYWAEKLLTNINLFPLMPDEDNNIGGFLVLGFREWWCQVQPKNSGGGGRRKLHAMGTGIRASLMCSCFAETQTLPTYPRITVCASHSKLLSSQINQDSSIESSILFSISLFSSPLLFAGIGKNQQAHCKPLVCVMQ